MARRGSLLAPSKHDGFLQTIAVVPERRFEIPFTDLAAILAGLMLLNYVVLELEPGFRRLPRVSYVLEWGRMGRP